MNWYLEWLRKYGVFGGRARRKEYWYFVLFNIIIGIVLAVIDVATGSFSARGRYRPVEWHLLPGRPDPRRSRNGAAPS